MSSVLSDVRLPDGRGGNWRWWVCGLLLLATTINYMDRLTLNLLKVPILHDLGLDNRDYGAVEGYFGLAFAVGALFFGLIVDRWNVFWVYPAALVGRSIAGFVTGFSQGFWSLLMFRMMLGLFEAANWPCALRTTQRILPPNERSMGNSLLQSGAAVGAVVIPLLLMLLFDEKKHPEGWGLPFRVVGAAGIGWVALWMLLLRPADLALHPAPTGGEGGNQDVSRGLPRNVFCWRFAVLIVLVVAINMTWHFLRAWLPSFLREQRGFTQNETNFFCSAYYLFTDVGALGAGAGTLWLVRSGFSVHASRRLIFLIAALLASLCLVVPFLPRGWPLVGALLVVGFGSLGMFPVYYSFSQDLTVRSQGKVTGVLGACCWGAMFLWQNAIGQWVHHMHSYALPFIIAGVFPLCAFAALLLLWGPTEKAVKVELPAYHRHPLPPRAEERVALEAAAVKEG